MRQLAVPSAESQHLAPSSREPKRKLAPCVVLADGSDSDNSLGALRHRLRHSQRLAVSLSLSPLVVHSTDCRTNYALYFPLRLVYHIESPSRLSLCQGDLCGCQRIPGADWASPRTPNLGSRMTGIIYHKDTKSAKCEKHRRPRFQRDILLARSRSSCCKRALALRSRKGRGGDTLAKAQILRKGSQTKGRTSEY